MLNDFKVTVYKKHTTIEFKNFYEANHESVLKGLKKFGDIKNHHIFVVKREFLMVCDWDNISNSLELFKYSGIAKYLDSSEGPAVIDMKHDLRTHFNHGEIDKSFHWPKSKIKVIKEKTKKKPKKKTKVSKK